MTARTRALALALAAAFVLVVVASALAATGEIVARECIDDNDPPAGDTCARGADGLGGVVAGAPSPDGRSYYAVSVTDDAIAQFSRSQSGALNPLGCVHDEDSGVDACQSESPGLDGAFSVAVSPEGNSVYVAAFDDDAIVRFDRNPTTGTLSPQGCIDDNDAGQGPDSCAQSADGLDGVVSLAVSPDGRSLYAASLNDDAIVRFDRGTATGTLTPQGCIDDNDSGTDSCSAATDGLDGPRSLTVSPDGLSLYAAGLDDDAIVRFDRNPGTGALLPQGCVDDNDAPDGPDACAQSADGLGGALGVTSSAGTTSLYVQSVDDEAVVWFVRQDEDPPETTIVAGPPRKTKKRRASFEFVSSEPFSSFECKLDKRGFKPCGSPRAYSKKLLRPGEHAFRVRALDEPGNTDETPAKAKWKVRG